MTQLTLDSAERTAPSRTSRHALAFASLLAVVVVAFPPWEVAGAGSAAPGKKGGEACEHNGECQTGVCEGGRCHACPSSENCPPPGNCSEDTHATLHAETDRACKESGKLSCKDVAKLDAKDADCTELEQRRGRAKACADARWAEMDTCFRPPNSERGGDEKHRAEHERIAEVHADCTGLVEHKLKHDICSSCTDYKERLDAVGAAWKKPDKCDEKKEETKADCKSMAEKISNAGAIKSALDKFRVCFNGQLSEPRLERYRKASQNESHCRDVLDYKQGKKLCR